MDGALRHIGSESGRLRMRSNSPRQEEITDEIELILLTAESLLRRRSGALNGSLKSEPRVDQW